MVSKFGSRIKPITAIVARFGIADFELEIFGRDIPALYQIAHCL